MEVIKRPTEGEINALKAKHGRIYEVEVGEEGNPQQVFILREPDRATRKAVGKMAQADPVGASEIAVKNCVVWGDEKALDDFKIMDAVSMHFDKIMQPAESRLKNL